MKMLDLFSGMGGFSLAAEWCWGKELEIVGFVEIDPFCQKVLRKHWPDVPIYSDIKDFHYNGAVELITGGFPCQDISIAGKGVGIEGERSGLWSEFRRIIGEVRPRFALIENVPMLIHRGLGRVLSDLAEIGYNAEWQCISAAEVGAWHKRERIWIVAYPTDTRDRQRMRIDGQGQETDKRWREQPFSEFGTGGQVVPDSKQRIEQCGGEIPNTTDTRAKRMYKRENLSDREQWQSEPNVGRVAHGIPNRVDRLKSLGNAIVPQVAYVIMQQIKQIIDN